jgi:hypothetical protein
VKTKMELSPNMQREARKFVAAVKEQIDELQRLHAAAMRLLVPNHTMKAKSVKPRTGRTDWSAVLAKLPSQFRCGDMRQIPEAASHTDSEQYGAICRWLANRQVRRVDIGLYEKTGAYKVFDKIGADAKKLYEKIAKKRSGRVGRDPGAKKERSGRVGRDKEAAK